MDREGKEIKFIQSCSDLNTHIETLGPEHAVVFETGLWSFYWADKIEETGALCFIINPYKFRIIKDSWNKTDIVSKLKVESGFSKLILFLASNLLPNYAFFTALLRYCLYNPPRFIHVFQLEV
jgi:hypothetical protein